ncbi:PD40 domain-containing protein [Candidatus Woesearchaeota archaeon]|nr:PD40 domain-containing protein [Candidatus Woesearchaeota archaeon]
MKQILFIVLSLVLSGCQSYSFPIRELYRLPSGQLSDIAWLDNETIIMDINTGAGPILQALDINSLASKGISIESECKAPYIRSLKILPNQRAGFLHACLDPRAQVIQEVNLATYATNEVYVEPYISTVGNFTYSPDLKEKVLVDDNGIYMDSSLYYLDASGNRTNITPDFQRADFPSWSPTDDVVAFFGTRPRLENDTLGNWGQIANLLDYPWKLYMYSPEKQTIDELPLEVVGPNRLKWSPDGKILAFTGKYQNKPGVWMVNNLADPNNLSITKIVDGLAIFDFSPDSKSITFAYVGLRNTDKQNILYIVDLNTGK